MGVTKPAENARGRVKWFDMVRGFGFIVSDDCTSDVLFHSVMLQEHGRLGLPEGTGVEFEYAKRQRGLIVSRVLSFDLTLATRPDPEHRMRREHERARLSKAAGPKEPVIVRWFDPQRGFGFVVRPGSLDDIYIHHSVLRRAGLGDLTPDQVLHAVVAEGDRGLTIVSVEPDEAPSGLRAAGT